MPVYFTVAPVWSSQGFTIAMKASCSVPPHVPITVTDWPLSEPAAAEPDGPLEAPADADSEAIDGAAEAGVDGAAAEEAAGLGVEDAAHALATSAKEAMNTPARASVARITRDNVHSSIDALTRVTNAHYHP